MKRFSFKTSFKYKAHIDITAMIDLVFLLLVFFMATSSMGKKSSININLPKASKVVKYKEGSIIISVDKNNKIYVNDKYYDNKSLLKKLKLDKQKFEKNSVIIRGDKKSNYETIIKIMDYLNQAGISKFTLSAIRPR